MYLPWTKEAKASKLFKQHAKLYHELTNFNYHSLPEIRQLQREDNANQLHKLQLANHALRQEFSTSMPYNDLYKVPGSPGIVTYSTTEVGITLPEYSNAYSGVIKSKHLRSELISMATTAYFNLLRSELTELSNLIGYTCEYDSSLVIHEILSQDTYDCLHIKTTFDFASINEIKALAKYHKTDIILC